MTKKKTVGSKIKTSTTKIRTRKKKSSDIKEDWPLTDFSENPTVGNLNSIEIGDFVQLERSMITLNGNTLYMRGVEVKVKNLISLDSGIVIAQATRHDGTELEFYACWLKPVLIEEPIDINNEDYIFETQYN